MGKHVAAKEQQYHQCRNYRAPKSREISRENTAIFAHMWHQHSLLGVNQYGPPTLMTTGEAKQSKWLDQILELHKRNIVRMPI